MPTEVVQRGIEQLHITPRRIRAFLVRHGQQKQYIDTDSMLTADGRQQVITFTTWLLEKFAMEEDEKIVKIVYSDRPRTTETAVIIRDMLQAAINKGVIDTICLSRPRRWKTMQTADPLHHLMMHGISQADALSTWLTLSEEALSRYNADPPSAIARRLLHMVQKMEQLRPTLEPGPEINYIMVTHETSTASILHHFDPSRTYRINYVEPMQIDIGYNGQPSRFAFRDKEYFMEQERTHITE